jgi:hypothetical protein
MTIRLIGERRLRVTITRNKPAIMAAYEAGKKHRRAPDAICESSMPDNDNGGSIVPVH